MNSQFLNVLGIGFGPSNLALAAAFDEKNIAFFNPPNSIFLEKNPTFSWHSGMLIPDMILQVPFLRDLATLRNPQSPYTFINYLKEKNRLDAFINLRTFYPTRVEFHDYFSWASTKLSHLVQYNTEVKSIHPIWDNNTHSIQRLKIECVDTRTQKMTEWLTDNLIISAGKTPAMPDTVKDSEDARIIHTSQLLHTIPYKYPQHDNPYHFIIVGSGQSAGEAGLYLLRRYPNASVSLCFRTFSLCGIDSSPYVNQKYHQLAIEKFYQLDSVSKEKAHADLKTSNYAVIDTEILREFYNIQYHDALMNKERLKLYPGFEFKRIESSISLLNVSFQNIFNGTYNNIPCDGLILATGYNDDQCIQLLSELEPYLIKNNKNEFEITQDYQLKTSECMEPNIYLQGYCEHSHGPSDPTLAVIATRAESILNSIHLKAGEYLES